MNIKKIMITGATGFIGQTLVPSLLGRGYDIVCVVRSENRAKLMSWYKDVEFVFCDISKNEKKSSWFDNVDVLVHLAWSELSNYQSIKHVEKILPDHIQFLHAAVEAGVKQVLVTGTCLEYGMKNGELFENDDCEPHVPYAIAKDKLRKYLTIIKSEYKFNLQWVRLFYLFGNKQNESSLLPQLELAVNQGNKVFNMSKGDQLRDFISIDETVDHLCFIIKNENFDGIINCSTGKPISVRSFVENRIEELNADITLNLGFYPYPDYEPMEFWGSNKKMKHLIETDN